MKYLLILPLLTSILFANEIQRIEAIVDDIANLRVKYEKCKIDLQKANNKISNSIYTQPKTCKNNTEKIETLQNMLQEQKDKNAILLANISAVETSGLNQREEENSKINKEILRYKNLLKQKEVTIKSLKNKLAAKESQPKVITKTKIVFKNAPDTNKFPKLVPKKIQKSKEIKTIREVQANTFRLNSNTNIYDSIDGKIVDRWEKNRSFTSNIESKNWIKITGYFIDKQWHSVDTNFWILKSSCIKR